MDKKRIIHNNIIRLFDKCFGKAQVWLWRESGKTQLNCPLRVAANLYEDVCPCYNYLPNCTMNEVSATKNEHLLCSAGQEAPHTDLLKCRFYTYCYRKLEVPYHLLCKSEWLQANQTVKGSVLHNTTLAHEIEKWMNHELTCQVCRVKC